MIAIPNPIALSIWILEEPFYFELRESAFDNNSYRALISSVEEPGLRCDSNDACFDIRDDPLRTE